MNNGKSGIRIYDGINTIPLLWKQPMEKKAYLIAPALADK
jgi:hypothetical protein